MALEKAGLDSMALGLVIANLRVSLPWGAIRAKESPVCSRTGCQVVVLARINRGTLRQLADRTARGHLRRCQV